MKFEFKEPVAPKYIYINPKTNVVHLLLPVVSGTQIGLDNTCLSALTTKNFFAMRDEHDSALYHLLHYKEALEFDIKLSVINSEVRDDKQHRLKQIDAYIKLVEEVLKGDKLVGLSGIHYPKSLHTIMEGENSNLYSMRLSPQKLDNILHLHLKNIIFCLKRNDEGSPVFYQALKDGYKDLILTPKGNRYFLTTSLLELLKDKKIDFDEICRELKNKAKELFALDINLDKTAKEGYKISKEFVDTVMEFDEESTTAKDYITALLGLCANDLFDTLIESPFYILKDVEKLSILTQFFLAEVNIYCKSNGLSSCNFGAVLDGSKTLCDSVIKIVVSTMKNNANVEDALFNFVNSQTKEFGLKTKLTSKEMLCIKTKFTQDYNEITDSPHFDEFTVVDSSKPGNFVVHQGSICTDFCLFVSQFENTYFTKTVCEEFKTMKGVIAHKNDFIQPYFELDITAISDDELLDLLKTLPDDYRKELLKDYSGRIARIELDRKLLALPLCVARGQQAEAEQILKAHPDVQDILLTAWTFTDYSGRTFTCTAYEYAYWAKDIYMCRMLESLMNDDTKAKMFERIEALEAVGLSYQQHGLLIVGSKHFDCTAFIKSLEKYVAGFKKWGDVERHRAWMKVGEEQRDVPAHYAQQWCRQNQPIDVAPSYKDETLLRTLAFSNLEINQMQGWFPLEKSNSMLGAHIAIVRGGTGLTVAGPDSARTDLEAIKLLDTVMTVGLKELRKHLKPSQEKRKSCVIS